MTTHEASAAGHRPAWLGTPMPLGASWNGGGTNFAVYSATADAVSVALFDRDGTETRVPLPDRTFDVWHGYLPGVGPGQRYGFRSTGRYRADAGQFHDPSKLLLDPYARTIEGDFADHPSVYPGSAGDSAPYVPRSIVIAEPVELTPAAAGRPDTPFSDSVIYELHVRGFTRTFSGVPQAQRGTYAGLGSAAAIEYLLGLGVTAVELLPVQQFVTEPAVARRGRRNYWGYNPVGFFAPHAAYSSQPPGLDGAGPVREFRTMVAALHGAGIEVILDVVYNHTAEGPVNGPVLSFRGLDNHAYYRHAYDNTGQYLDYTGCGNTVDARVPSTLGLIMDSLRYWVSVMGVDGFRFDLASALARSRYDFDHFSAFFAAIAQDPVLASVKLIAEPWDLGANGYQVGRFPTRWSEWNGAYRDSVRDFWGRGRNGHGIRDLAYRLTGSSDLYRDDRRQPWASINFVTAHDGFTLRDLVSYETKHNLANGEGNRDGTEDNRSYNCGIEGETSDPAIRALRLRQARNLLTTLLLSTGVPMLTAGDERWRTQLGNNNAYCVDDPTSWLDWTESGETGDLTELTRRLLALRRASPVLRRRDFFDGVPLGEGAPGVPGTRKDVAWFAASGRELGHADWFDPALRTVGMYLDGHGLRHRGARNEVLVDASYLLVLHAGDDDVTFALPAAPWADRYQVIIDTNRPGGAPRPANEPVAGAIAVPAHCSLLLRVVRD
ncbi:MAG: glycogen debranching protein GlgX [Actinomycetota bacterium]|nr:glycogen debranching protein GlgX [Actinomycetota bacterium]